MRGSFNLRGITLSSCKLLICIAGIPTDYTRDASSRSRTCARHGQVVACDRKLSASLQPCPSFGCRGLFPTHQPISPSTHYQPLLASHIFALHTPTLSLVCLSFDATSTLSTRQRLQSNRRDIQDITHMRYVSLTSNICHNLAIVIVKLFTQLPYGMFKGSAVIFEGMRYRQIDNILL